MDNLKSTSTSTCASTLRGKVAAVVLGVFSLAAGAPDVSAEDKGSPRDWYQKGREAYYRNDFNTAKAYFSKVIKVAPTHGPTAHYLAEIAKIEKRSAATDNMQGWAARVVIPSLDVEDAGINDVLTFFRVKAKELTGGRFQPNFIVHGLDQAAGEQRTITLKLTNVPLDQLIKHAANLAGLAVRYEEHAIILAPPGTLPPAQEPVAESRKSPARGQANAITKE